MGWLVGIEERVAPVNAALRPIAEAPVDISDPDWVEKLGCVDFAHWISGRALEGVDDRFDRLADHEDDEDDEDYEDDRDDAYVAELQRRLRDLDLIVDHAKDLRHADLGLPIDTSVRLRAALRDRLAERD